MNKPFSISVPKVFAICVVITLGWLVFMGMSVKPLNSQQIVAFELAKTPEVAVNILTDWRENNLIANAKRGIYLDFVFLVLYSLSIALGCLVVSNFTGNHFLIQLGCRFSKIALLAGSSDVIENIAMLRTLSGAISEQTTAVAYWFAVVKFSIVIVLLLFVLTCLIFGVMRKILSK